MTFGSFNNPAKVTPCAVAAWAEILRRVTGSRLVLKYQGFDQPGTCRHYEGLFAAGGVGPERLELLRLVAAGGGCGRVQPARSGPRSVSLFGRDHDLRGLVDGGAGDYLARQDLAGRHSLSHLSNVGLTETVVRDVAEYVELAVRLARDLPRLAKWRAESARASGQIALVRRAALRSEPDEGPALNLARVGR